MLAPLLSVALLISGIWRMPQNCKAPFRTLIHIISQGDDDPIIIKTLCGRKSLQHSVSSSSLPAAQRQCCLSGSNVPIAGLNSSALSCDVAPKDTVPLLFKGSLSTKGPSPFPLISERRQPSVELCLRYQHLRPGSEP